MQLARAGKSQKAFSAFLNPIQRVSGDPLQLMQADLQRKCWCCATLFQHCEGQGNAPFSCFHWEISTMFQHRLQILLCELVQLGEVIKSLLHSQVIKFNAFDFVTWWACRIMTLHCCRVESHICLLLTYVRDICHLMRAVEGLASSQLCTNAACRQNLHAGWIMLDRPGSSVCYCQTEKVA